MANLQSALIGQLLAQLGFETIRNSSLLTRLQYVRPEGETALRDATLAGLRVILKLNQTLAELGASEAFSFVHIVITDGVDTVSKTSLEELAMMFALIGRGIPKERCLTVFIGVELSQDAALQLALLAGLGGDTCQLYNVNKVQLGDIFERISASIGVRREVNVGVIQAGGMNAMAFSQRNVPILQVRRRNFAVLLNLDISGSMNGQRFNSLRGSVQNFMRNLDGNDIASCLVFNDRVQLINNYQPKQNTNQSGQPVQIRCAQQ